MLGFSSWFGVSRLGGSTYFESLRRGRQKRLRKQRQSRWESRLIETLEDRSLLTIVGFTDMIAEVTASSVDGDVITAHLQGSASIDVADTPTQTGDGRDTVQTEIVSMSLQGFDSYSGPLDVRVSSVTPSLGATTERRDVVGGQVDTVFNVDSFFDVSLEIDAFVDDPMNPMQEIQVTLYGVAMVATGAAGGGAVPVAPGDTMNLVAPFDLFLDPGETMPAGFTVEQLDLTFDANFTSISGQKWNDLNGDGVKDPGEPGLDNWIIVAFDVETDTPVEAQVTRSIDLDMSGTIDPETESGLYEFTDLAPGFYFITEMQQTGWGQTFPDLIPPGELPQFGPGDNWLQFVRQGNDFLGVGMLATFDWNNDGTGDEVVFVQGNAGMVTGDYNGGSTSVPVEIERFDLYGNSSRGPVHIVTGDSNANLSNDGPLYLGGVYTQEPMDPARADSFFDIFVELDVGNTLGGGSPPADTVWTNSTPIHVEASVDRLPDIGQPYHMTNASPVPFFDNVMVQQAQLVDLRFTSFRLELFQETVGYFYTVTQGQQISNVSFGNEDFALGPFGVDYGDAPEPAYPTLAASNGANHVIDGKHFLGRRVDAEDNGQPNAFATGDDLADPAFSIRSDDEDGVLFLDALVTGQTANIIVEGSRLATQQMLLSGWIDWNGNGDWSDGGDQVFTDVAINPGSNSLAVNVPAGATTGVTYARFRVSTQSGLSFTGSALNGEVEDYSLVIYPSAPPTLDWGDAPDPLDATAGQYPTLAANNGAYHLIDGVTVIGNFVSGETDGQPNVEAKGDLVHGVYDNEDGIVVAQPLAVGDDGLIFVNTLSGGFLNAWIDFNADGDWDDANERIAMDLPLGPGRNSVFVDVPPVADGVHLGQTFARFRLSPNAGEVSAPTGPAVNAMNPGGVGYGEVEDVALTIFHGELIAEGPDWEVAVNPQQVPPGLNESDPGPVGITTFQSGPEIGQSVGLLNQEWYWFAIDGGVPQRLDTLALVDASDQYANPLTLTYGDAANGDPIQVALTLTLNETSTSEAAYSTMVVITNLTGSTIDLDFFSYTDATLNGSLGRLDRATVVSATQIDVNGVTGSSVSHQVTGTAPDHYQIGTVGSNGTAFEFQSGTLTNLTDSPAVSSTTASGNVAHAFQWSRTVVAAGTLTLESSHDGVAVPVELPQQIAGGSIRLGIDPNGSGERGGTGPGGIGGSAGFGGPSAPPTGNPKGFDPAFALGYDFAAQVNRFSTVELPTGVGDDQYTLSYLDDLAQEQTVALMGGVEFDFNSDPNVANGVDTFRVLGIETSEMIDVEDPFGFVTLLSFVSTGPYAHTQTGIPEFIYVAGRASELREDVNLGSTQGVLEAGDEGTWLPGTASEETGLTFGYTLFDSLTDAQNFVASSGYTGLSQIVTSPPAQITSVSPQANSHTAAAGSNISATFDQAITGSTVTDQTFVVQALQTGRLLTVDGNSLSTSGATITLNPAMDFKPGELVHVTATAGIEGPGEIGVEPRVWQFSVAPTGGSGVLADSGQLLGGSSDTFGVALGDLDGDGDLDAFVANDTHQANRVLVNQRGAQGGTAGMFVDSGQTLGSSNSLDVALGDVDGDGDLDAVVANSAFQSNRLWLNQGGTQGGTPGIFADSGQSLTGGQTRGVALGDFDADGDLDIFFVNYLSSENTVILLNDGSGVFTANGQTLTGHASRDVAVGDLDGDGDLDAYVAGGGTDRVWLNQGGMQGGTPGTFSDSGQTLGSDESQGVALGDVDGDGDLDAFVTNANGSNRLWINQGGAQAGTAGQFSDSGQTLGSGSNWVVALGDVDADGDLDAFVTRRNGDQNQLWLNQGGFQGGTTGVFSDSGQSLGAYDTRNVVLADVNGDGSLDAFLGVFRAADRVLINAGSDSGDAPAPYATTLAEDGPRHVLATVGLHLGASVDAEVDGVHSSAAIADDVADALPDDEDGVLNPLDLQGTEGATPSVTLLVTNTSGSTATLAGWIDYNGDGVFDNTTERATTTVATGLTDARITLTFPAIPDGSAGLTYARFRLSTDSAFVAAPVPTGAASDGEVEDYAFSISVPGDGTVGSSVKIASSTNGGPVLDDADFFGRSITSLGDLDGDGVADLAVGARGDDSAGYARGAVHVLLLNADGTVKSSTKIASSTNGGPALADSDFFGTAVAAIGDLDGDGVMDLAVGGNGDDTGGGERGAVHVLLLNADGTVKGSTKIASGTNGGPTLMDQDFFGVAVASIGDLNGDGVPDLVVGAMLDDTGGSNRGAVHVLMMNADGTVASSTKIASGTNGGPILSNGAYFGFSATAVGDVDGDGITDLAVGSYADDTGGTNRGAVYVLLMNADGTAKSATKIASDTNGGPALTDGDAFGFSVAAVGDLDGDGINDLAVGAYRDNTGGTDRGAVHVLLLNSDGTVKSSTKIASGTNGGPTLPDNEVFGSSLTSAGDLNGDGTTDLAVGAFLDGTGGPARGAVYVLLMNELQVTGPATVTLPSGGSYSVLIDGGDLVVNVSGGAELFRAASSTVTELNLTGSAGDDSLTIDFSGGSPIPSGGIHFDGGVQSSSGDSLTLLNGTVTTVSYQFDNANDGSIVVDGQTITYTGLEPIFDDLAVADRVFAFGSGADAVTLSDDSAAGNGRSRIAAPGSGETVDFINPTNSLTINLGGGADSLLMSVDDLDGFAGMVTFNGDAGADSIDASLLTLPASINGGDDDDILSGGSGDDTIDGGNGSDVIVQVGDTDFTLTSTQLISTLTGSDSLASIDRAQLTGGVSDNTLDASAFGGATTLTGGDGNDTLTGSAFADNLTGNGGDDLILGGDGNDTLNGGSGKDELIGGAGDDLVQGQGSTGDTLEGGDGDDTLDGGSGNDLIREAFVGDAILTNSAMSGRGNDIVISAERAMLTGSGASQSIDVGAFFTAGLTSVTLDGGSGDDTLVGSDGSDVLNGAGGSDVLDGRGGNDRLFGGAGADTLLGGTGDDLLKGLGGTGDRLSGGDGDDTINGGRGVDRIFETGDVDFTLTSTSLTGLGTDVVQAIEVAELNGGPSDNVIDVSTFSGFKGFTLLRGNGGNDSIIGSSMSDVINGGNGNDTLLGKGGDDTLNGEDGNDGLSGYTGNDVIDGGRGYDRGFGGEGNDTLLGGNAIDTLIGGNGDDSINGNDGIDTLVGGTGNNDASPGDVITDATANIDEAFMLDPLPDWVDQV